MSALLCSSSIQHLLRSRVHIIQTRNNQARNQLQQTSNISPPIEINRPFQQKTTMSASQQQAAAGSSATRAFFGAIKETVTRGRSRSRSPNPSARQADTAELRVQQPQQQPAVQQKPAKRPSPAPVTYRTASQSTSRSSSSTDRSDWHRVSYGRHSTDVSILHQTLDSWKYAYALQWIFTSQSALKRQSTGGSSQYSSRS